MTLTQSGSAAQSRPSVDHLLDAPLPQLLAELDVELVDSSITDATFFGALVERRDGSRILSMPVGRSVFERDTAARMLLAEGLGLDAPPVPAPLAVMRG
ncbi:hypothetical protein AB0L04_00640 [Streptomyces glaucescens]|uniref:hypothetical protein n=1 Tax=Streptomyces glaucescens TaxID=1907 RepID=UPI00344FF9CF